MPTPRGRHRHPEAAGRTASAARSRRPAAGSRALLLVLLATLSIVLASGVSAVGLSMPGPAEPPDQGGAEAIGSAPAEPAGRAGLGAAPLAERDPAASRGDRSDERPDSGEDPDDTDEQDVATGTGDEGSGNEGGGEQSGVAALEAEVTALTNAERAQAGCAELGTDDLLGAAARGHSADMAERDYFSHTSPEGENPTDRANGAGYSGGVGENIAMGYPSPEAVMDGWMNSDGHRQNLLNCGYTVIGVGLAYDDRGRPYWTQNFG